MTDVSGAEAGLSTFRPRHVPALDGIRGLAICLILLHHTLRFDTNTGNRVFDILAQLFASAWIGVDLFFVLSGFLITGILYDSVEDEGYFRKFYMRRFLRIFPLYYGVLFVLLALTYPLHIEWRGTQWTFLFWLQNTGLLPPGYHQSRWFDLDHFWSLAVEEQFYLLWPFLVYRIANRRQLILTAIGLSLGAIALRVALVLHGASHMFIYEFGATRGDSLLIGGALALAMRSRWRPMVAKLALPIFAAIALGLLGYGISQRGFDFRNGHFIETTGFTFLAIAAAALIAETFRAASPLRTAMGASWLRFMGRYSYGIYVFHYTLTMLMTNYCRAILRMWTGSKAISVVVTAALVICVTILIAVLSYNFYEKPFLRLKKYFEYRGKRHTEHS